MIDEKDLDRLKEIFVTRKECDENVKMFSSDVTEYQKKIAVIEAYQKITLGVLSAVGVGVLGIVLNMLFHLS